MTAFENLWIEEKHKFPGSCCSAWKISTRHCVVSTPVFLSSGCRKTSKADETSEHSDPSEIVYIVKLEKIAKLDRPELEKLLKLVNLVSVVKKYT